MVPVGDARRSTSGAQGLFEEVKAHTLDLPKTLFIPAGQFNSIVAAEALRVSEDQLRPL